MLVHSRATLLRKAERATTRELVLKKSPAVMHMRGLLAAHDDVRALLVDALERVEAATLEIANGDVAPKEG